MAEPTEIVLALFCMFDQPALLLEPCSRRVLRCNPAAERLWPGYAASGNTRPLDEWVRFIDLPELAPPVPAADTGMPLSIENRAVELLGEGPDGSPLSNGLMTARLATLGGADGTPAAEVLVLSDASAVMRWRDLTDLTARAQHPAYLVDGTGHILMVSHSLAEAIGYGVDELIGKRAVEFMHPDDAARIESEWARRREAGAGAMGIESRWRGKSGGQRWFAWYTTGDRISGCVYAAASDITERKRQELLFNETASAAHVGGWELDLATRELYWTNETYRLHDTSPEEYTPTGETALSYYTGESQALVRAALERSIADGTPWDLPLDLVTARGRRIKCRAKGEAVFENGLPTRVYGIFQDISAEDRVAQALRESEELLRSILRDMSAGLVAQHPDGSIMFANQAALDILGLTEDQIMGKTSIDEDWYAVHEDGSPFPGETHPAMVALRTGQSVTNVIMGVYRPRTQDRVWILIDAVVQRDHGGAIRRVLSSFIDITDRKRAEDAARASDARFRAVYENAGVGVLLRDPDSRFIECNPTFARMLGRSSEDMRAMAPGAFIHPEDRDPPLHLHQALLDGRRDSYELERRFVRRDGELVWGHVTVSAVRAADGAPRQLVEVIVDVTDRKRMETQLLLADRLASLGTMAAGMGHEINNPLTWIIGNITFALELLREMPDVDSGPLGEIRGALEEASVGAARVRTIVRDLLLFSRVDDTPGATADVNQVVQSTCRMLRNEIDHRTEFQLALESVPAVIGDTPRIGQVLTNLLINALHALPERPRSQNLIRVSTRAAGERVVLEVSDNGTGIPPELQSRIFDPFFTTRDIGSGAGLGLSICHSLVTRLGGDIEVESEPGRGTTFRVFLQPAARMTGDAGNDPHSESDSLHARKRILCIDDEPNVGHLIARSLREAHEVVIETDSVHALERLYRGEHYDAIICELMMPNMSGMEFLHKLQEVAPALVERCGFIAGSVFTDTARAFAEQLPDTRLVHKPFEPRAIQTLIGNLTA